MKGKLFLISLIFFSFILFAVIYPFHMKAALAYQQNEFLKKDFHYICLYDGNGGFAEDFHLMNRYYSVYHNNTRLPIDIIMPRSETIQSNLFELNGYDLKPNEVLLSENLIAQHGLKVGDRLTIKTAKSDEPIICTVKGSIDSCYSITDNAFSSDNGLVICGYDSGIANMAIESIAFVKNESLAHIALTELINKNDYIILNEQKLQTYSTFSFISFSVSSVAIWVLFYLTNKEQMRKQIIMGVTPKRLFTKNYTLPIIEEICLIVVNQALFLLYDIFTFEKIILISSNCVLIIVPILFVIGCIINNKAMLRRT